MTIIDSDMHTIIAGLRLKLAVAYHYQFEPDCSGSCSYL